MTCPLPDDLHLNTSFSRQSPGLQLAVDSTSLGDFKTCPRKYYYNIICGYQPRVLSVHLTFGLLMHSAREIYYHWRAGGANHEDSLRATVAWGLGKTWNHALKRGWQSGDSSKNRLTFLRSIVWYLDKYGQSDPLETVILANGKPAVELSFQFDSGFQSASGEPWLLCGHFDRLVRLNGDVYVSDLKTTGHSLDGGYFSKFSPDNQFSLYVLAGRVALDQDAKGLIVDALQIIVSDTRFQRGMIQRSEAQCEEWLQGTGHWLRQMEQCAQEGDWPQNDKSCSMYGGCQFRTVCSKSPESRQRWLDADFAKRRWDPLQKRGDI